MHGSKIWSVHNQRKKTRSRREKELQMTVNLEKVSSWCCLDLRFPGMEGQAGGSAVGMLAGILDQYDACAINRTFQTMHD